MDGADTLSILHGDHLDSTVLETDSSGSVVSTQQYGAYGSQRGGSSTLSTDHRFTGQKLDGTGLLYYNARYFDPELGIFISPDAMIPDPSVVIDYNRYAYVRANPMKYQDPSGNFVETLWDVANVGIGIASLTYNVSQGNWTDAAWDAGGLIVDAAATVIPIVPGGAATALKVARAGDKVVDTVKAVSKSADTGVVKRTGAYFEGAAAGGSGLGKLAERQIKVMERGVNIVKNHLDKFGYYPENSAMISRLDEALLSGKNIDGADASFYMHEVSEATKMKRLMQNGHSFDDAYEVAHKAALDKYEVSPFSVYHPKVIQDLGDVFNDNWRKFWGIEP